MQRALIKRNVVEFDIFFEARYSFSITCFKIGIYSSEIEVFMFQSLKVLIPKVAVINYNPQPT